MTSAGYEFNARENEIFQRLVKNMARTGAVGVVASLILLAYHLVDYFGLGLGREPSAVVTYVDYGVWAIISIIGIAIGVALVKATAGFTALIRTEGDDVTHLMQGIERLAAIFGSICAAAIVASLLLVMSFLLLVMH
jgi:hypothetical protein